MTWLAWLTLGLIGGAIYDAWRRLSRDHPADFDPWARAEWLRRHSPDRKAKH
jgi:hypothetical protein